MKRFALLSLLMCAASLWVAARDFASGADVSWATEMEADGCKFRTADGVETDIFALMKQTGMSAVRLRVWVNPTASGYRAWCDKADVLVKARRAHAAGLDLMIDFHYSDIFADPGRQDTPADWQGFTMQQVCDAIATHTSDVLTALKDCGISPRWVQVGNETNSGMVMDYGKIDWDKTGAARFANYATLSNAGYDAVKAVFPDAKVIVHLAGAQAPQWFFPDFKKAGGKFDIIGISHYPTEDEWESSVASHNFSNVNAEKYVKQAIASFDVPVMICETGFNVWKPALAQRVMIDLFNRMKAIDRCEGIFYWEPQVDGVWKPAYYSSVGWGAYSLGAFTTDGRPTKALDAFGGKTHPDDVFPASLSIMSTDGTTLLATLLPVAGSAGVYSAKLCADEPWLNFLIADTENNTWYGSDPADKTQLSSAAGHWNLWIDSETTGTYDITVDLNTMHWSHSFSSAVSIVTADQSQSPALLYDLTGRRVHHPVRGNIYIVHKAATSGLIQY